MRKKGISLSCLICLFLIPTMALSAAPSSSNDKTILSSKLFPERQPPAEVSLHVQIHNGPNEAVAAEVVPNKAYQSAEIASVPAELSGVTQNASTIRAEYILLAFGLIGYIVIRRRAPP